VKRHPHGAFFPDAAIVVAEREPGWEGRLDVGNPEMLADLEGFARGLHVVEENREFPYRLVCRRLLHTYNSSGQDLEQLRRRWPYNPAFMHPDDLAREGFEGGDLIEITSENGAIRGVVQPDATLREGLVSMPHSFGGLPRHQDKNVRELGSNPGRLLRVDDGVDRYTGQPRMSNLPVQVHAVEPAA
jgi:anaerobic selenocysteine-containing dehydrogenase